MEIVAILTDIEHVTGGLDPVERFELRILLRGGVTADDMRHALDAWSRSHRVTDDWGYLRAVMLRRAADRMVLQQAASPATTQ